MSKLSEFVGGKVERTLVNPGVIRPKSAALTRYTSASQNKVTTSDSPSKKLPCSTFCTCEQHSSIRVNKDFSSRMSIKARKLHIEPRNRKETRYSIPK